MIQASNIHKHYDDLHVLKGVNLNVKKSEIISIAGASGAGKTTLLQILGTLDYPSKTKNSSLIINNIDVNALNEKELAKFRNKNLGFIFQFHQLLPCIIKIHQRFTIYFSVENRKIFPNFMDIKCCILSSIFHYKSNRTVFFVSTWVR